MELTSNLVWLAACAVLFGSTVRALRRGTLTATPAAALTATFAVCLLLLPVISMSDDLLRAQQDNLPLSAQTWHLAAQDAETGLVVTSLVDACLLALLFLCLMVAVPAAPERMVRRHCAWLTRSQRLRPPPPLAL